MLQSYESKSHYIRTCWWILADPLIDWKLVKLDTEQIRCNEDWIMANNKTDKIEGWSDEKLMQYIKENNIVRPNCEDGLYWYQKV